jgi:hypothetical protein
VECQVGDLHAITLGPRAAFLDDLPPRPMQSAANCWVRRTTKNNWIDKWQSAAHGNTLRRPLPKIARNTLALYQDLTPTERSALIQARTGKIGLNAYLYSIDRADTTRCPQCSEASETVRHILIDCPGYFDLRV